MVRVLIADDSRYVVERLVALLEKESGVEIVGQAGTAGEAMEAIRKLKPDVVILDISMPGGSGIDVLKGLQRDQLMPIVIVLSNYGQPQYRRKCLESGARFFLDKSTEFEMVAEVLRSLAPGASVPPALRNRPAEPEEKGSKNLSQRYFRGGVLPEQEETTTTKTPVLLVGGSVKGEPIYFMCSACLRGFPLPDIQPPAQAARELLRCFQEHVAQEHPGPAEGDIPDAAA